MARAPWVDPPPAACRVCGRMTPFGCAACGEAMCEDCGDEQNCCAKCAERARNSGVGAGRSVPHGRAHLRQSVLQLTPGDAH